MSMKKTIQTGFVAGAVALAMAGTAPANAEGESKSGEKEKCYGVAKAGHNDCGDADGDHSCMGQATVSGDGNEWVAMPAGLCEKLVGGSLEPYEGTELPADDSKEG